MEADESTLTSYMDRTLLPLDSIRTDGIQKTKKGFTQIFYGVHGIFAVDSEKRYRTQRSAISGVNLAVTLLAQGKQLKAEC